MWRPMELERMVRRRAEVKAVTTEEGTILLDVGSGRCWELNDVGAFIWERLKTAEALSRTVEAVCGAYGVAAEIAQRDVLSIAGDLLAAGLIEPVRSHDPSR
jgi:hypothetical protein